VIVITHSPLAEPSLLHEPKHLGPVDPDAPATGSRNQAELLEIRHRTADGLAPDAQHLRKLFVPEAGREVQPVATRLRFCNQVQELCAEPNEQGLGEERLKLAMRRRQAAAQFSKQLHQRVGSSEHLLDQETCRDFKDLGPFDCCGTALLSSATEAELAKDLARAIELHKDFIPRDRDVGQLHETALQEEEVTGRLTRSEDSRVSTHLSRRTREQRGDQFRRWQEATETECRRPKR
jgi:hypothetical protein